MKLDDAEIEMILAIICGVLLGIVMSVLLFLFRGFLL